MGSMHLFTQQDGSITCKFNADYTKYAIGHEHNTIPSTSHPHNFCKTCPTVILPSLPWSSKWTLSKSFTHSYSTDSLCNHLRYMPSPLWSIALPSDVQNLSCCGNIAPVWPVPMNIQVVFVAVSSFWLLQVSIPLSVTECQIPKVAHLPFFKLIFQYCWYSISSTIFVISVFLWY